MTRGRFPISPKGLADFGGILRNPAGFIGIIPVIVLIMAAFGVLLFAIVNIYSGVKKFSGKGDAVSADKPNKDSEQDKLIVSLKASLDSALKENLALTRKGKDMDEEIALSKKELALKNNQIDSLVAERAQSASAIEKQSVDFKAQIKALEDSIEGYKSDIQAREKSISDLNEKSMAEKKDLESKIDALESERRRLTEMVQMRENDALLQETAKMHYNLANILVQTQQYDKAISEYLRALELLPNDAQAHYNLAVIYDLYGSDPISAVKHYRKSLELDRLNPKRKEIEGRIVTLGLSQASKLHKASVVTPKDSYITDGVAVKGK